MQLKGWHGTTSDRKAKILIEDFSYRPYNPGVDNERHPNDLGNGCYFFLPFGNDSGKEIATEFTKKYKSKDLAKEGIELALINVNLEFENDSLIFDLDSNDNQDLLEEVREMMVKEIGEHLKKIKNDGAKRRASRINKNQGLVIEIFLDLVAEVKKEIYSAVQSTTYTELKDVPVIDGKNGKEICVRNTKCITIIS